MISTQVLQNFQLISAMFYECLQNAMHQMYGRPSKFKKFKLVSMYLILWSHLPSFLVTMVRSASMT